MSSIRRIIIIALLAASAQQGSAFTINTRATPLHRSIQAAKMDINIRGKDHSTFHNRNSNSNSNSLREPTLPSTSVSTSTSTSLQMGYNLPPGGGGSNPDPKDALSNIVTPLLTIAATVLFFLSPLGSIFFAITNSIVLLLVLLPFVATIAFQGWQYFYTIEAPCPSCGATARVLKDEEAGPNICLNCGSLLRANLNKDGVELCNDPNDLYDDNSRISSFFDLFTGGVGVDDGARDEFIGGQGQETTTTTTTTVESKEKKERRERTIIDVDVTKDE